MKKQLPVIAAILFIVVAGGGYLLTFGNPITHAKAIQIGENYVVENYQVKPQNLSGQSVFIFSQDTYNVTLTDRMTKQKYYLSVKMKNSSEATTIEDKTGQVQD